MSPKGTIYATPAMGDWYGSEHTTSDGQSRTCGLDPSRILGWEGTPRGHSGSVPSAFLDVRKFLFDSVHITFCR